MILGFTMASYAVVANDALQTLGTFRASNAHRPWWLLWLWVGGVLVAVLLIGYAAGDVSYGRLAKIPEAEFDWWLLVPPAVLVVLTRCGIPVSTTFLVLTAFNPRGLGSMVTKSLLGYVVALAVGYLVYRLVMRVRERHFAASQHQPARGWVALQWLSTGFLWSQWLVQNLANMAVYLPRQLTLDTLLLAVALLLALHAWILARSGERIQRIVDAKVNTTDIRSATIIDFIYALILLLFKELSAVPMSTTWVFLGLLAGRELGIMLRSRRETARAVLKDAGKGAIGLAASVVVAFAVSGLP